jgi:hypothetical protein
MQLQRQSLREFMNRKWIKFNLIPIWLIQNIWSRQTMQKESKNMINKFKPKEIKKDF